MTLIHRRHVRPRPPSLLCERHFLGVSLQATPRVALSVLNVHLPPRLSVEQRGAVVDSVARFAEGAKGVQLLCGDLNKSMGSRKGSWLGRELRNRWSRFHCPYRTGVPTNVVTK